MIGYKGFNKDMECRGLQYRIGKKAIHCGDLRLCSEGIHFCENPHEVFKYYEPSCMNRFALVEANDVSDEKKDDSKRVCRELTVKEEMSPFDLGEIAGRCFFERIGFDDKIHRFEIEHKERPDIIKVGREETASISNGIAKGEERSLVNAGAFGIAVTGYGGAAKAGGDGIAKCGCEGIAQTGSYGVAVTGDRGIAVSDVHGVALGGRHSVLNTGHHGVAIGESGCVVMAGDSGVAVAGDFSAAHVNDFGIAIAGHEGSAEAGEMGLAVVDTDGRVRGKKGAVLIVRKIKYNYKTVVAGYEIIDWACAVVDGKKIKADTWYRLEDGKLVEDKDEEKK